MKNSFDYKKALPHILAIVGFFVIMAVYFSPALEGKVLKQHDIVMAKSMQKEITKYTKESDETILWTNSIFSGMPTYQIWMRYPANVLTYVMKYVRLKFLPDPFGSFFLYFIGFYILLLVLKIRVELAFIGGLAFAFSSYNLINIEAGHLTKGLAVAFAPLALSGIILTLQKKYLLGAFITALALGLEIRANHLQITYYLFLMILVLMVVEFIYAVKDKRYLEFAKSVGVLLIAGTLAITVNLTGLWVTQEYTNYTMRGGSDLTQKQADGDGLEKDYALSWSYGVGESFTLLIPGFSGGASTQSLSENSKTYQAIVDKGVPKRQAATYVKSMPTYWGAMRSTSGPIYIGAIIIFLFVLGMFLVKDRLKWWILATAVLALMLAWGENFKFLTNIFFDYFPLYNKFRVPMTLLLVVSMTVPILSMMALNELVKGEIKKEELLKSLKYSLYSIGGLILFFGLFGGALFEFVSESDTMLESGDNAWLVEPLRADRARMLRLDSIRSLFFILVVAGSIYGLAIKKLKLQYFFIIIGLAILVDLWGVDRRYFNKDDFHKKKRNNKEMVAQRGSDSRILQDADPHFRVMDLTVNAWNDASPAYYHKFIGGYHGAKLSRYQDMIEYHLNPELQKLVDKLRNGQPLEADLLPVYNMLNTKYFIASYENHLY